MFGWKPAAPISLMKPSATTEVYIRTLTPFFGEMKMQEIDGDQVRAFQKMRLASVSAGEINKECSVLQQMRKRIGLPLLDYQPLPVSKESPGRALTDQEDKVLSVAGKFQGELEPAHCFVLISKNTGGGPKEIRSVRLKDINPGRAPHLCASLRRQERIPHEQAAAQQYRFRRRLPRHRDRGEPGLQRPRSLFVSFSHEARPVGPDAAAKVFPQGVGED